MASLCAVSRLHLPPSHHHKIPTRRRILNHHGFNPLLLPAFDSPPHPFISSRSKCVKGLQRSRRNMSAVVWASPSSNSGPSSAKKDAKAEGGGVQGGPPLLTILAGFLVFLGFCWVVTSIGTWLFNLIVFPPPPK